MRISTRTLRVDGGLSCVDNGGRGWHAVADRLELIYTLADVRFATVYTSQNSIFRSINGGGSRVVGNRSQVVSH